MTSNTVEIEHVLTSTFGLQTATLEQCVPLSVGDVPTMKKDICNSGINTEQ